jgi:hypothetical protein
MYNKKLIGYSFRNQLEDIYPFILTSLVIFALLYGITLLPFSMITILLIQFVAGAITFVAMNEIIDFNEYQDLKVEINRLLQRFRRKAQT